MGWMVKWLQELYIGGGHHRLIRALERPSF